MIINKNQYNLNSVKVIIIDVYKELYKDNHKIRNRIKKYINKIRYNHKAKTVYDYIQKRYKYYDYSTGKNNGEKYTDTIFFEASEHFHDNLKNIEQLYFDGSNLEIEEALKQVEKVKKSIRHKK